jgi:hypothetical protein
MTIDTFDAAVPPPAAHHPASHPERAYAGSGVIALWIMMALMLAWFVPFAFETARGILTSAGAG